MEYQNIVDLLNNKDKNEKEIVLSIQEALYDEELEKIAYEYFEEVRHIYPHYMWETVEYNIYRDAYKKKLFELGLGLKQRRVLLDILLKGCKNER